MESIPLLARPGFGKMILVVLTCWALPVSLAAQNNTDLKKPLTPEFQQEEIREPPVDLKLDPFYQKYVDAGGIPVVSSEKTTDDALLVASTIVNYMLQKRQDVKTELIKRKCRVLVMAQSEMETDLPERRNMKKPSKDDKRLTDDEREMYDKPGGIGEMTDRDYWNQRARGMGGNETSCAEENLLGYEDDRYYGENILVHEFSHTMFFAIKKVDPGLYSEVEAAYEAAKNNDCIKVNMQ